MAPSTNNQQKSPKKRAAASKEKGEKKAFKPSALQTDKVFCLPTASSGHVCEYGDKILFACGAATVQSDHYRSNCVKCQGMRMIMDSWADELEKRLKAGQDSERPPPLSMAGVEEILDRIGVSWDHVTRQDPSQFSVYEPFTKFVKSLGKTKVIGNSIVMEWNKLSERERLRMVRPPQFWPCGFALDKANCSQAVRYTRATHVQNAGYQYVVNQALLDGLVSKDWLNKTLENFGIVPKKHKDYENLEESAVCPINDLYNWMSYEDMDLTQGREINLDEPKANEDSYTDAYYWYWSPRRLMLETADTATNDGDDDSSVAVEETSKETSFPHDYSARMVSLINNKEKFLGLMKSQMDELLNEGVGELNAGVQSHQALPLLISPCGIGLGTDGKWQKQESFYQDKIQKLNADLRRKDTDIHNKDNQIRELQNQLQNQGSASSNGSGEW